MSKRLLLSLFVIALFASASVTYAASCTKNTSDQWRTSLKTDIHERLTVHVPSWFHDWWRTNDAATASNTAYLRKHAARERHTSPQKAAPTPETKTPTILATDDTETTEDEEPVSNDDTTSSSFTAGIEAAVHARINEERADRGLVTLMFDTDLAAVARDHSADMAENDYFDHTNLDNCSSACRLDNAGYSYRAMGENIYMMSGSRLGSVDTIAESAVEGWMNSAGHRANILRDTYTHEGIGVAVEGTAVYITEVFSLPR